MPDGMVHFYDERGRRVLVSRCDWAEKVLPQNFQKTWDDADALYEVVAGALGDGFLDCVLPAIARLMEIDPRPGRAAALLAAAQLKGGKPEDAERTLRESIRRHGETGAVLIALARALAARGGLAYEDVLRRGLSLDPNQENGLDWYALLHKERGGPEAYRAALEDVAREPGAWLPLLRLGRSFLEGSDAVRAMELFRRVLAAAPAQSAAWTGVTGALGQAGLFAELAGLCGPLYDPEKNPPPAGIHLARAWLETGRVEEARSLVEGLRRLGLPPLAEALDALEAELSAAARPSGPAPALAFVLIEGPLWARGLGEPAWLLPRKPAGAKRLGLLAFADETRRGERLREETEDDRGRLSRALPLFLSEALAFTTGLSTHCAVPLVPGRGLALCGKAWDVPDLLERGAWEDPPELLVSGAFVPGLTGLTVELELWDAAMKATLGRVRLPAGEAPAAMALELEHELSALLAQLKLAAPQAPPAWHRLPAREGQEAYLQALALLLTHVLAAEGLLPPGRLWNEQGMLESYDYHCGQHPSAPSKLLAVCGTLCSVRRGSPLPEPHRRFLLEMIAGEGEPGPVTQLSPLVFLRLGERKAFEIARERLASHPDPGYRAWLAGLG